MDDDSQVYRKKKPSHKSKSEKRSDHKHVYEPCIVRYIFYEWGERCRICGRTRTIWNKGYREFLRPGMEKRPGIGMNDFLSVRELREKFGVPVYEEYWKGHEVKTKEVFE